MVRKLVLGFAAVVAATVVVTVAVAGAGLLQPQGNDAVRLILVAKNVTVPAEGTFVSPWADTRECGTVVNAIVRTGDNEGFATIEMSADASSTMALQPTPGATAIPTSRRRSAKSHRRTASASTQTLASQWWSRRCGWSASTQGADCLEQLGAQPRRGCPRSRAHASRFIVARPL